MQETIRMEMLLDIKMRFVNYYFDDKNYSVQTTIKIESSDGNIIKVAHEL